MKAYLPLPQKSSDLLPADYQIGYGLSPSVAAEAIKQGMASHIRIYEALLRMGSVGLQMTADDLAVDMSMCEIPISPAQIQRVLTDTRLFTFVGDRITGKRGRPKKLYRMVSPQALGESLGFPIGARREAPQLHPVDLSSCKRYKLAIFGRATVFQDTQTRAAQVESWQLCRQTIIRWTQITCDIIPQITRSRSDDPNYQIYPDDQTKIDVFLWKVGDAAKAKPHMYWLEVVNGAGEIRKLPCTVDNAHRWLARSVVTLCQQHPNRYRVHLDYRDPPLWMQEMAF